MVAQRETDASRSFVDPDNSLRALGPRHGFARRRVGLTEPRGAFASLAVDRLRH